MKEQRTIYNDDGGVARFKNRRISFKHIEGIVMILFENADTIDDPAKPACVHSCSRGKVRKTFIKMSDEAMEELMKTWARYKLERIRGKKNETTI